MDVLECLEKELWNNIMQRVWSLQASLVNTEVARIKVACVLMKPTPITGRVNGAKIIDQICKDVYLVEENAASSDSERAKYQIKQKMIETIKE
jgi:hypothetical protein